MNMSKSGAGKGKRPIIGYNYSKYDSNWGNINWGNKNKVSKVSWAKKLGYIIGRYIYKLGMYLIKVYSKMEKV